jgi:hypothetical protein
MIDAENKQEGGNHYREMAIQPMRYSMMNNLCACAHTIIKYASRYPRKDQGLQDLYKIRHTVDLWIKFEEERERLDGLRPNEAGVQKERVPEPNLYPAQESMFKVQNHET